MKRLLSRLSIAALLLLAAAPLAPVSYAQSDYELNLSLGFISGKSPVRKFGKAPAGIQTTLTDFWARADATPTQQIWLAPTAARIHTIASTSVNDTTGGTGANSVIITYLADWDTTEATETVTGNLNAGIAMTNAAVMINRIAVVPQSTSTSANVGTITATAATDATITAVIRPGVGQTQQAIYGVPSTHSLVLTGYGASINDNSAGSRVDVELLINPDPETNPVVFLHKDSTEIQNYGSSNIDQDFIPYEVFAGPCIVKVSGIASAADIDASAHIHGVLVAK